MTQSQERMMMRLILEPKVFTVVKNYTEEYTGDAQNGDVFIVQQDRKSLDAGVYCAENARVIRLKKKFFISTEVRKVDVLSFTRGNRFAVYRKNGGIPHSFRENVKEAMSRGPEYSLRRYNCMELVMDLLEVDLKPTIQDGIKIGLGTKPRGFKVVKKFSDHSSGHVKLGDLLIVESGMSVTGYHHAGVCCCESGQEIIHFTPFYPGSFGLSAAVSSVSTSCPGLVSKVNIKGFTHSKFAVYRKKTGISDSFQRRVAEAMKQSPKYQLLNYNCIHFALELYYGDLEARNSTHVIYCIHTLTD
ncbi:uncharacterized protein LOC131341978 [Hemibagrus wyckioides]|uniref:uncharacterized protein LOC131341978 n=1 Tax=Hemibagrus wyckioides TaxID=337641 RepID=UPI00266D03C5|nr:uncharacterized protein LOC131341978 [Hemibagrus wyckioides]